MKRLVFFILCLSVVLHTSCDREKKGIRKDVSENFVKETASIGNEVLNNQGRAIRFAIFSLKDVAQKSRAGQSIDNQIAEINNKSKEDLLELENSIRKMDSNIRTNSDERKVEDLQVILYDMTKEKRYQIQKAYKTAVETLEEEIQKVVKDIAEEKGYSLIMVSDVVVYNTTECPDITKEAIEKLDERVPMIKVSMDQLHSEGKSND